MNTHLRTFSITVSKCALTASAVAALVACSPSGPDHDSDAEGSGTAGDGHAMSWGYSGDGGPEHWGDLSEEYALCSTGKMQSPIDLGASNAQGASALELQYGAGPLSISNNGHTVQADFAAGSQMVSGADEYALLQVHFHTPSEAVMNGKAYPMVAHFVHQNNDGGLAVLGILFEEGEANAELQKIVTAAPAEKSDAAPVEGVEINPMALLPSDMGVFRFQGSLTTPPCSEGVRWHIAKQSVSASSEQIASLHQIMGNNARPAQPLNDRLLVAP